MKKNLTFRTRFSNIEHFFPESRESFRRLLELAAERSVELVEDENRRVDIEIQSSLNEGGHPPLLTRFSRFTESRIKGQIDFSKTRNITNQQPYGGAKVNIFYSAENHRPPPGAWDAYLTFDTYDFSGRNAYFPLWWLTCTDLLGENPSPFLGRTLTVRELATSRNSDLSGRDKFCAVFAGKAWPFRMHAINELTKIGKVDVFGDLSRSRIETKSEIGNKYRFILCFENDIYPGYVTEKLPEAWATGAVPLYWGEDRSKFFNSSAFLNLNDFDGFEGYLEQVKALDSDVALWSRVASQPLLSREPNLNKAISTIRDALISKKLI